jgi:hypothetical protein
MAKFGVAISWLDQIGKTLQELGERRNGIVTKHLWAGQEVALQTFSLQEDDGRDFSKSTVQA